MILSVNMKIILVLESSILISADINISSNVPSSPEDVRRDDRIENINMPLGIVSSEIGDDNKCDSPPGIVLQRLRTQNRDTLIVAYLNINFLCHKFEALKSLVQGNIDILMVSETKLDNSFPINQFTIEGLQLLLGKKEMPMGVV